MVGADAVCLTTDQLPPELTAEGWLKTRPALVVEVLGKNNRPYAARDKLRRHLLAGAPRVLAMYTCKLQPTLRRQYAAPRSPGADESFELRDRIPGFVVPVRNLFG